MYAGLPNVFLFVKIICLIFLLVTIRYNKEVVIFKRYRTKIIIKIYNYDKKESARII